jgi:hypothetical protein
MNDPDKDEQSVFRPPPDTDLRCKIVDEDGNEIPVSIESHLIILNVTPLSSVPSFDTEV